MSAKSQFLIKYGHPDHTLKHFKTLGSNGARYGDDEAVAKAKNLHREHLAELMQGDDKTIAGGAARNPNAHLEDMKKSPHKSIRLKGFREAGTHDELMHLTKSGDRHERIAGMFSKNSTDEHVKSGIMSLGPYKHGDANSEADHDDIGSGMLRDGKFHPVKSTTKNKPKITDAKHEHIAKLSPDEYKKMHKYYDVRPESISQNNVVHIMTSPHTDHVNMAMKHVDNYMLGGSDRVEATHHMLALHPHLTDDTIRHVGVRSVKQNSPEYTVQLAMHPNASKETVKAIHDAMPDNHRYKAQVKKIMDRK